MTDWIVENAEVVLPDQILHNCCVAVKDGRISKVCASSERLGEDFAERIDAAGDYLAPGFIDLHIHGLHYHLIDNSPADLSGMCRLLPRYGVTSFLPTVCPRTKGEDAEFLASLAKVKPEGAQILGFHLEGPFLCLTGALPPEALGKADSERVKSLKGAAAPYKAIFSISPEFEGIDKLIPIMTADNTPAFITHTGADVDQTRRAIQAGARHATHFYDVFPCAPEPERGKRPCGAVEAILADPGASLDFILDGEHVDPIAVEVALRCKGPDMVSLISDSNIGAGLPPGRYSGLEEHEVEFEYAGGPARMTERSVLPGALAGSGLTLDRAVRNAIRMLDLDLPQAVRMWRLASKRGPELAYLRAKKSA